MALSYHSDCMHSDTQTRLNSHLLKKQTTHKNNFFVPKPIHYICIGTCKMRGVWECIIQKAILWAIFTGQLGCAKPFITMPKYIAIMDILSGQLRL